MKIGLFLDVDKTLTTDFIQTVFAKKLGVVDQYRALEDKFQKGEISSARFGTELVALFASKNFTKAQADDLFGEVCLRHYVPELFALQERGVEIYLVSSGPSYYIKSLAQRNGIPDERTLCSIYMFDTGIISSCSSVDAARKTKFVSDNIAKYDVTIGIGDNHVHDAFVQVCTIAMLTTADYGASESFIHVAQFNSVHLLIDNLLKGSVGGGDDTVLSTDDFKGPVTIGAALKRISLGLWILFAGCLITVFGAGYSAHALLHDTNLPSSSSQKK
jgi:HAD superfamily phosphoserine phosphatase-like hydrolase